MTGAIAVRHVFFSFFAFVVVGVFVTVALESVAAGSSAMLLVALGYVWSRLLVFDLLRLRRGARLLLANRADEARAVFARLVKSVRRHGPTWPTIRVTQHVATMLLATAPDEGIGHLEALLAAYPGLAPPEKCLVQHAIAHARLLVGNADAAAAVLEGAVDPPTPVFWKERGQMLARADLMKGRPEAALDRLEKLPDDKVSETLRAHALVALRHEDQAREILLRLRRDHGDKWLADVALYGGPAKALIEEIFGKASPKVPYR